MRGFLSAHGYEPGPTQRPLLAGAISGVIATAPAIAILLFSGALRVETQVLALSEAATVALGCVVMAIAGALYARLFGRAANDARGGWLFGMAFGFALWAAGAVLVLPLASGGMAPAGTPAMGVFLSLVAWGGALGTIHPFVHRPLHQSIESASKRSDVGPGAATSGGGRGRRRDLSPPQEASAGREQPQ